MSWLLDTCVVSELVKPRPAGAVLQWVSARDEATLYLSALTLGELAKGIASLARGERKLRLLHWLHHDLRQRFEGRIIAIDEAVALCWGEVQAAAQRRGRPMPVIDGMIAASALVHGHQVVTRNGADMAESGVGIIDPWAS